MKEIYKNPILYYIAVPVIMLWWPLLVWAIYLPNARQDLEQMMTQYKQAEPVIMEILTLDPDRLEAADPNETTTEFTYYSDVDKVASLCGIPPSKCKLQGLSTQTSGGQKSQSANVKLNQIDITKFARFLSTIQVRWPSLQCTKVILTQKPGLKDVWDVDVDFKYYY
jgi:hypothetical protein